jgi:anaerobic selenocysteine-containing dehydrogenase
LPERVARITWVAADEIRRVARALASQGALVSYTGLEYTSGTQNIRAVLIGALTGNLDVPGGK